MSKVSINETTLTAIGDAIRAKTGKSDLIAPGAMPDEIASITTNDLEIEPIVLTGNISYAVTGTIGSTYIKLFGNTVSTNNLDTTNNAFFQATIETIPFELNFKEFASPTSSQYHSIYNTFAFAYNLKTIPAMNNCRPDKLDGLFQFCHNIRYIPEDLGDSWDWTKLDGSTGQYTGSSAGICNQCHSLRQLPMWLYEHGNVNPVYSYSIYYNLAKYCRSLDEIVDLPNPHKNATWTSNAFYDAYAECYRIKNMTFKSMDPMNWKSQTIDLSNYCGWGSVPINLNPGITAAKRVTDDASYQALKNDPDWYTTDIAYSRYNHDSAVNTINSLPDTSAYLAANGGTNTIKFKGAAGSKTDGGAINTLTDEEIAVATAKGWTVTIV